MQNSRHYCVLARKKGRDKTLLYSSQPVPLRRHSTGRCRGSSHHGKEFQSHLIVDFRAADIRRRWNNKIVQIIYVFVPHAVVRPSKRKKSRITRERKTESHDSRASTWGSRMLRMRQSEHQNTYPRLSEPEIFVCYRKKRRCDAKASCLSLSFQNCSRCVAPAMSDTQSSRERKGKIYILARALI